MDIPSIAAILGTISNAIDIIKRINNTDNPLGKAEVKLQFANLISELATAKVEITNIQQQLLEKDQLIRSLNEQIILKEKLQYEPPYYWQIEGDDKVGPFCQVCYEKNNEVIRLHEGISEHSKGLWNCKVCKNSFTDRNYSVRKSSNKQRNWKTI